MRFVVSCVDCVQAAPLAGLRRWRPRYLHDPDVEYDALGTYRVHFQVTSGCNALTPLRWL
jgi:hypothetical protein